MEKVILRTKGMIDRLDMPDEDRGIWKDIYDLMDGEIAYVCKNGNGRKVRLFRPCR